MKRPTNYVPLAIDYFLDPTILEVSIVAEAVYARGLAIAKRDWRTDGLIDVGHATTLRIKLTDDELRAAVDELVRAGLWSVEERGWRVRNWLAWNTAREEIDGRLAGQRERQRRYEERRRVSDASVTRQSRVPDVLREQRTENREPTSADKSAPKRQRRPDRLWDAVLSVCGLSGDAMTKSGRGSANRAVGELRDIGADPDEVPKRAAVYRRVYPRAKLTPTALAKHWPACDPAKNGNAEDDVLDKLRAP